MKKIKLLLIFIIFISFNGCGSSESSSNKIDIWSYLYSDTEQYKEFYYFDIDDNLTDFELNIKYYKLEPITASIFYDDVYNNANDIYIRREYIKNENNITKTHSNLTGSTNEDNQLQQTQDPITFNRFVSLNDVVQIIDVEQNNYNSTCRYSNHFDTYSMKEGYTTYDDVIEIKCTYEYTNEISDINSTGGELLTEHQHSIFYYSKGYGWIGDKTTGLLINAKTDESLSQSQIDKALNEHMTFIVK